MLGRALSFTNRKLSTPGAGNLKTSLAYEQLTSSPQRDGSLQTGKAAFELWLITLRALTCFPETREAMTWPP